MKKKLTVNTLLIKRYFLAFVVFMMLIVLENPVNSQTRTVTVEKKSPATAEKSLNLKPHSFNFFLVSDWGWNGFGFQTEVANQMAKTAEKADPEFIISCGDNFQVNGVQSVNDPLWMTTFENVYKNPELLKDWYPVLGNHDYKGNPDAEVKYSEISRRWRMPARYYTVVKKVNDTVSARFIFTDTSPLVNKYYEEKDEYSKVATQDTAKEMQWLHTTLANAKEQWIFVIGHHPVFSASPKHGNTPELIKKFKPLFDKYNVDFYFCGHDHDMQHLKPAGSKVDYIVTGSGGEIRPTGKDANTIFSKSEPGFTLISISGKELTLSFISSKGQVVYSMTRVKK